MATVCAVAVIVFGAWTSRGGESAVPATTEKAAVAFHELAGSLAGVRSETIGYSLQGRAIDAFFVGSGPLVVAVIGGLHTGTELDSVEVVEELLGSFRLDRPMSEVTLVFVPVVNPDGLELDLRVNARGVDLNRNWPSADWSEFAVHSGEEVFAGTAPLSEPETAALFWFLNDLQPAMTLSFHGFAGVVEDNGAGGASALAETYASAAGYEHIEEWEDYHITGQMIDSLAEMGLPAADVELLEDDPIGFERNLAALRAMLVAAVAL